MKVYPDYLPRPLRRNYDLNHKSPFARTEMVTGRARQRRTFQSVPTIATLEWYMKPEQAQLFEAWFKYDITDGAEWFEIDLKTPVGHMAPYMCRFTEMYQGPTINDADDWEFSAELEIRERPVLGEFWYRNGQSLIMNSSIIDLAINREWPSA